MKQSAFIERTSPDESLDMRSPSSTPPREVLNVFGFHSSSGSDVSARGNVLINTAIIPSFTFLPALLPISLHSVGRERLILTVNLWQCNQ
jgi:hypothetical protein